MACRTTDSKPLSVSSMTGFIGRRSCVTERVRSIQLEIKQLIPMECLVPDGKLELIGAPANHGLVRRLAVRSGCPR